MKLLLLLGFVCLIEAFPKVHPANNIPGRVRRAINVFSKVASRSVIMGKTQISKNEKVVIPKDQLTRAKLELKMHNNALFTNLSDYNKNEIFDAMFVVKYNEGQVIIKQGEHGDYFYVIESGQVDVYVNGQYISTIKEGGSFGELALISGKPRAATIKAKTAVKLWAVDRLTYRRVMMKSKKYDDELLSEIKQLISNEAESVECEACMFGVEGLHTEFADPKFKRELSDALHSLCDMMGDYSTELKGWCNNEVDANIDMLVQFLIEMTGDAEGICQELDACPEP